MNKKKFQKFSSLEDLLVKKTFKLFFFILFFLFMSQY